MARTAGRWEVYDQDGAHLGWVIKASDGLWRAYVPAPKGVVGSTVSIEGARTRSDAVDEVWINRETAR